MQFAMNKLNEIQQYAISSSFNHDFQIILFQLSDDKYLCIPIIGVFQQLSLKCYHFCSGLA